MPSGPSKQELEMYWQSSRQYFDELAAHYKQADPQYYKQYIEPFYTNPFAHISSGKKQSSGSGKAVLIVVLMIVLAIGGMAAFAIIYLGSEQSGSKELEKIIGNDKKTDETSEKKSEKETITKEEEPSDPSELSSEDNFIIGSKYIGEKKYDKAEYHLRKVKKDSKYYEQSKQLLESLKFLRQYDK